MGWNEAYTIIEKQVIALYNSGQANANTLKAILDPYRGYDVDHGGCYGLKTMDGKSADDVIIEFLASQETKDRIATLKRIIDDAGITTERLWAIGSEKNWSSKDEFLKAQNLYWDWEDAYLVTLKSITEWC